MFRFWKYINRQWDLRKTKNTNNDVILAYPFLNSAYTYVYTRVNMFCNTTPILVGKYSLVSVFHVVSASTPHPIPSQILRPARPRAAARVQTTVSAGAGHGVRYAGCFDRLYERCLAATCNGRAKLLLNSMTFLVQQ